MKRLLLLAPLLLSSVRAAEPPDAAPGPTELQRTLELPLELRLPPGEAARLPEVAAEGPLVLSLEQAVLLALRYNRALTVEQLNPLIEDTFVAIEQAAFDPTAFAELSFGRGRSDQVSTATGQRFTVSSRDTQGEVGVRKRFATGTEVELSTDFRRSESDRAPEQHAAGLGLSVTQALLQGRSREANLVDLRQAELQALVSRYQLRGFAETLVAEVERTYWDYVLSARRLAIFENSLQVAERQLEETRQRIAVGALPEADAVAARAEVARRRQELIDAQAEHAQQRLALLRLVSVPSADGWERPLRASSEPRAPTGGLDPVEDHVRLALRMRAELNEARLLLRRGELEVIQTRNGLLPRLDLFIVLGKSGYADSFGGAFREIDGDSYDLQAGLRFEYPLGNRAADAAQRGAVLQRSQAQASIDNLAQLVALEVRQAYLALQRAQAQIEASAATRELQEAVLRTEQARFREGRSTGLLVAQAQRDLLQAQIAEVEAVVTYRQALTELYRLDGSLLVRRAIAAPGEQPYGLDG